jgi:hypothetical protein
MFWALVVLSELFWGRNYRVHKIVHHPGIVDVCLDLYPDVLGVVCSNPSCKRFRGSFPRVGVLSVALVCLDIWSEVGPDAWSLKISIPRPDLRDLPP